MSQSECCGEDLTCNAVFEAYATTKAEKEEVLALPEMVRDEIPTATCGTC